MFAVESFYKESWLETKIKLALNSYIHPVTYFTYDNLLFN